MAKTLTSERELLITATDFDRLSHLVDSPRYRTSHAILLMTLKSELDRGRVVASDGIPNGVVTMKSRVRVRR